MKWAGATLEVEMVSFGYQFSFCIDPSTQKEKKVFPIRFHFFSKWDGQKISRWTVKHSGSQKKLKPKPLSVQRGLASLWRWENMALNGSRFGLMATSSKNLLHPRRQMWNWTESSPWWKLWWNYESLMKDFRNSKLVAYIMASSLHDSFVLLNESICSLES